MGKNYYELLGLDASASQAEVDEVCLKKASEVDPSKYPGKLDARIKFLEIEKIYETLGDPIKRAEYDADLLAPLVHSTAPDAPQLMGTQSGVINPFLMLGIIFIPLVFCWFLLQPQYSHKARRFGFWYMGIFIAVVLLKSALDHFAPQIHFAENTSKVEVEDSYAAMNKIYDRCFDAGEGFANAYFANVHQAVEVELLPSTLMEQGCDQEAQKLIPAYRKDCYKSCEGGFSFITKKLMTKEKFE